MSTYYFLQSKDAKDKVQIVGHSKDEKTGEVYYKFISKAKAKQLLSDEMKVSPEYQYRIVKEIIRIEVGAWTKPNSEPAAQESDTTNDK